MASTVAINSNPSSSSESSSEKNSVATSSTLTTTTAKSSASTLTTSTKRSRKSEPAPAYPDNSQYLPIAPQQTTYFQNQGLALASVQQQLQPGGSVAVFTSPTMAMATQAGQGQMGHQQQLVVAAPGQHMAPGQLSGAFNQPNGHSPQIIQAQGMGMMSGIPQVQVIQAGANGQPTYFQPFYTNQMQPMLLGGNLTMAIQAPNAPQGLAIQIPNTPNGTMIATNQPSTPVKNQPSQQPIIKSVAISPQATKSNASGTNRNQNANQQQQQQPQPPSTPTIIQQAAFPQPAPNQTFVIGTFPGSAASTPTNAAMMSASTTPRKSPGSNRSNTPGNKNTMIQKIQPATNSMASPILTSAQYKPNSGQYGPSTANSGTSPANTGQTIMVHGQNGIQLTQNQPTILSPLTSFSTLQPGITWATAAPQSTQLVTPNGQFFIRAPGAPGEPQMLFQTGNNQFQAVPMQVPTPSPQQQQPQPTGTTMQMTPNGQQIVTSVNQSIPISIQANQMTMTSTAMMSQPNATSVMSTVVATTSASTPTSAGANRQRLIRPAGMQSSIATQTAAAAAAAKSKSMAANGNTVPKLAPKAGSPAIQNNMNRSSPLTGQGMKITVLTKTPDKIVQNLPKSSTSTSTILTSATASKSTTAPKTVNSVGVSAMNTMPVVTAISTSTVSIPNNLVSAKPKVSSSVQSSISKVGGQKKVDKKDEPKTPISSTMGTLAKIKTSSANIRNGGAGNGLKTTNGTSTVTSSTQSTQQSLASNTQMINGVLCQIPPPKAPITNGLGPKANGQMNGKTAKKPAAPAKPKPDSSVLTHVIDGFVIMESHKPFPVAGYLDEENKDKMQEMVNGDSKEAAKTEPSEKDAVLNENPNGTIQPPKQGKVSNGTPLPCLYCGKNERFLGAKKKKLKKFCSQQCYDAFDKSKAKPNQLLAATPKPLATTQISSPVPIIGSIAPNAPPPPQQILNGFNPAGRPMNTLVPVQFASQPMVAANTIIPVVNGHLSGMKRPAPQDNPAIDPKRPRTLPNAEPAKEPEAQNNDTEKNAKSLLEGLWLPDNGNKEPNKWSVQDVFDFVHHLEGCAEFADEFKTQEIDGQALMLIKEDHIIAILNMKLGPALKICRKIKDLKNAFCYQ